MAADISTDPGQVDFSGAVLHAKQANADVLFAYLNEEESARVLRELRKQGYDKPIVGETTMTGQKVIDLAGDAANGVNAHVGLTVDAPNPAIKRLRRQVQKEYKDKSRPQRHQGLHRHLRGQGRHREEWQVRHQALAQAMHDLLLTAKHTPGVLMDVSFDDNGDIDREDFLVEVNGKQVVIETLPPASAK